MQNCENYKIKSYFLKETSKNRNDFILKFKLKFTPIIKEKLP